MDNPKYDNTDVAVGDLNSDAIGSGARKNAGKDNLALIPVRFWMEHWLNEDDVLHPADWDILLALRHWQEGTDVKALTKAISGLPAWYMDEGAKVFMFGANKYAAWNWAKGMDWSIPLACILRHYRAILHGEDTDPESGLQHCGHVVCNLIMLAWYVDQYPEGDDRPPMRESEVI